MRIVLFEDDRVNQLFPLTLMRPAYTICCGSQTLIDWALEWGACVRGQVRPYLSDWQLAHCPSFCEQTEGRNRTLLVNARVAPNSQNFRQLTSLINHSQDGILTREGRLVAAILPANVDVGSTSLETNQQQQAFLNQAEISRLPELGVPLQLLDYPHQIVQCHLDSIEDHLNHRIASGQLREVRDGVFVANSELNELVATDTSQGPIVIENQVKIRPFACLNGPIHLDSFSCVSEHTVLKNGVSIGRYAKVGGEIGASVIEAYSNKSHHGYLGHSYVGQWVNLGAGTSNSNLKNSYGQIRMEVDNQPINTRMQFMGCVIGDFTKSAINTSIFTGKLIGACSMLYGYVTTNVPSYANYARTFGQITDLNPEIVALTQKRAFQRRGIQQQEWQLALLKTAYNLVACDRQLADQPLSL
ncbi:MAG: putative sugar nucleotidyl transferase [Pirellulaceae bacterium]|nr:putative sugar nucleotidyl transferase [Pirellulaceae bacterium]